MCAHLQFGRSREMLVTYGAASRVKHEIDEVFLLPRLVEPVLGRPLGAKARLGQDFEGAIGVLLAYAKKDFTLFEI